MPVSKLDGGLYAELPTFRSGQYYVRVLADSRSPGGVRLTTLECRYPRFIHSEVLRHRVHSHSVESSRAVPTEINIEKVKNEPFVPATFNTRVKGMGVGNELDEKLAARARVAWEVAAYQAAEWASELNTIGLDKSRANRLMEPFMWVKDIITATEWSNFLALRCPPGNNVDITFPAQPEFQQFALLVRQALQMSHPDQLEHGWWHLPGATRQEKWDLFQARIDNKTGVVNVMVADLKRACARRMAKISFDKHDVPEPIEVSIAKTGELVSSGHFSPTEHIARPMESRDLYDGSPLQNKIMIPAAEVSRVMHGLGNNPANDTDNFCDSIYLPSCWAGNLRSWVQYRKEIAGEEDHAALLDYEVF
jgi:hypothetical protein